MEKEAPPGFEPGVEVLQTSALPLGYGAFCSHRVDGDQSSGEGILARNDAVIKGDLRGVWVQFRKGRQLGGFY